MQVASSEDGGAGFSVLGGDSFRFPGDEQSVTPAVAAFGDGFSLAWMGIDGRVTNGTFTIGHRGGKQGIRTSSSPRSSRCRRRAASAISSPASRSPCAPRCAAGSSARRCGSRSRPSRARRVERQTVNVPLSLGVHDVWLPLPAFRPEAGAEPVRTRVEIDPFDAIAEPDEHNNELALEQKVVDTAPLELLYVPVAVGGAAPTCATVGKLAAGARAFLVGAFPLDDRESLRSFTCGPPMNANPALSPDRMLDELLRDLASRRWDAPGIDKVVGVVPDGFFKDHYAPAPNAIGISPLQQRDEIPAVLVEAGAAAGASPTACWAARRSAMSWPTTPASTTSTPRRPATGCSARARSRPSAT